MAVTIVDVVRRGGFVLGHGVGDHGRRHRDGDDDSDRCRGLHVQRSGVCTGRDELVDSLMTDL